MYSPCDFVKSGGLDLSRLCLDRDTRSRHWQKVSLDSREILDTFKKLVSTIKISWSRLRYLNFVSSAICKSVLLDQDLSRLFRFLWISQLFLDLNGEIMDFYKYLDQDFYFNCRNLWKLVGEAQGKLKKVKVKPSPTTFHRCLKSKISR